MKTLRIALLLLALALSSAPAWAEPLQIAAASSFKPLLDEVAAQFTQTHPGEEVRLSYASSGKLVTQIRQNAPFDLLFAADMHYLERLVEAGLAGAEPVAFVRGRLVIWSASIDVSGMDVTTLAEPRFSRIAIANPRHAPYGMRAIEALEAAGIREQVEPRLVYGENIGQAAQFAWTGNAVAGLLALSQVRDLGGHHERVDDALHRPLEQGYVVTARGAAAPGLQRFLQFLRSDTVTDEARRCGFEVVAPGLQ